MSCARECCRGAVWALTLERCAGSNSPVGAASMRRARSAEAESPPTTQLYALRSRVAAAPLQRSPPGFGASPDPEAAAAADHAASTTMGPIKSRLKVQNCFHGCQQACTLSLDHASQGFDISALMLIGVLLQEYILEERGKNE